MKRENEKIVEVMGRKWKIRKFDAYTGSYILFQLMEKFLPMGLENKLPTGSKDKPKASLSTMLPADRTVMSKAEFMAFMRDCLSVVGEVLPARTAPVINADNGSWGVENIADNTLLAILLMIHALSFNVGDFFGGEGLTELKSSLAGILPASIKM